MGFNSGFKGLKGNRRILLCTWKKIRCETLHKLRLAVILSNTYVEGLGRSRTFPALLVLSVQLRTQVKKNKMGGSKYTCCGEERCIQDSGAETLKKETTWKTQI